MLAPVNVVVRLWMNCWVTGSRTVAPDVVLRNALKRMKPIGTQEEHADVDEERQQPEPAEAERGGTAAGPVPLRRQVPSGGPGRRTRRVSRHYATAAAQFWVTTSLAAVIWACVGVNGFGSVTGRQRGQRRRVGRAGLLHRRQLDRPGVALAASRSGRRRRPGCRGTPPTAGPPPGAAALMLIACA